mmetsp:Transcript_4049/g.10344  ORF Transcript_4049/g.10344 Transcript_4049/m.10344 type:complete len:225 (+) Transcript_4049:285-959(+)
MSCPNSAWDPHMGGTRPSRWGPTCPKDGREASSGIASHGPTQVMQVASNCEWHGTRANPCVRCLLTGTSSPRGWTVGAKMCWKVKGFAATLKMERTMLANNNNNNNMSNSLCKCLTTFASGEPLTGCMLATGCSSPRLCWSAPKQFTWASPGMLCSRRSVDGKWWRTSGCEHAKRLPSSTRSRGERDCRLELGYWTMCRGHRCRNPFPCRCFTEACRRRNTRWR